MANQSKLKDMATTTSLRRRHISLGYIFQSPARVLAFGFGVGLAPRGPGTAASLVAIPLFNVLAARMTSLHLLLLIACLFVVGVWACGRTGEDLGMEDHGGMVWDEIVAMLLLLVFVPASWISQAVAFGLFRLFDILKPGPVRYLESKVRGGLGVMVDDIVAAFLVLVCFALWKLTFGWPQWILNSTI